MRESGILNPGIGLHAGPDGWNLAPEGAAVHPAERVAVVADVHLGYEWARAARGDVVPPHSLAETTARLDRLLSRAAIDRLVVAGDLTESPGFCPRTDRDVRALVAWLEARRVTLVWLAGDHDPRHLALPRTVEIAGWTVAHGNRPLDADRTIVGHHHPVLRAGGLVAPCFLVAPDRIVLPAFSPNAAGGAVNAARWPDAQALRCVAGMGAELLDFGPLATLAERMARG